jgi:hypothetical protein
VFNWVIIHCKILGRLTPSIKGQVLFPSNGVGEGGVFPPLESFLLEELPLEENHYH